MTPQHKALWVSGDVCWQLEFCVLVKPRITKWTGYNLCWEYGLLERNMSQLYWDAKLRLLHIHHFPHSPRKPGAPRRRPITSWKSLLHFHFIRRTIKIRLFVRGAVFTHIGNNRDVILFFVVKQYLKVTSRGGRRLKTPDCWSPVCQQSSVLGSLYYFCLNGSNTCFISPQKMNL